MALVATLGASRSGTWSWGGLIVTGVIFCVAGTLGTGQLAPYFSLAPMEEVLRDVLPEDAVLVYEGGIDTASSLLFYSDRVVHVLGQNPNAEFATRTIGIGRDRFVSGADFQALWRSKTPVGFITERSDLIRWASVLGPLPEPVATAGTQVLLRNPLPPAE
jgi:hypothetical protein